jgi:RNA-directed DNA polymerase
LLGYKTLIQPSKEAIQQHYQKLQNVIDRHVATPQARLIGQLNPIIKGWTDYYAPVSSKAVSSKLAHLTFIKLKRWAKRRHPNKSWGWIYRKYWRRELKTWDFAPKGETRLYRHGKQPSQGTSKYSTTKAPMTAIGCIGQKDLDDNPAYRDE